MTACGAGMRYSGGNEKTLRQRLKNLIAAVTYGILPPSDPLAGSEVDLHIAGILARPHVPRRS